MKRLLLAALSAALLAGCSKELVCARDQKACGDVCANVETDARNCGACGKSCASGQACYAGACIAAAADAQNCGAAGRTCAVGETCKAGACVADLYLACFATNEVREATKDLAPAGVPVGTDQGPISLTWLDQILYAANDMSNSLTQIRLDPPGVRNAASFQLVAPAATADLEFVRAHDGLLFASNSAAGTILVLDPVAKQVLDEIPLAEKAGDYVDPLGFDFVGEHAFVALHGGGATAPGQQVAVVDFSNVATCTPPDPNAPACGAAGACATGKVCVDGLCQRPPCGKVLSRIGLQTADVAGFAQPSRVLALGTQVYVPLANLTASYAPAGNGKLAVIDASANGGLGALTRTLDLGAACTDAGGIAAQNGTVYVACASGPVVPVDTTVKPPAVKTSIQSGVTAPGSIAICNGQAYAGDQFSGSISRFDLSGQTPPSAPSAICPNGSAGWATVSDIACGF
ncbi:MAG TPA: hypothetical protein VFE30_12895 [Anaeromyxobacteraceae bacterium]|jgi:hypothetical protein|nr:hypothetical protein [Anaeromyxobacteraceae bacterium]